MQPSQQADSLNASDSLLVPIWKLLLWLNLFSAASVEDSLCFFTGFLRLSVMREDLAKIFGRALNYPGHALPRGRIKWPLEVPSNLNYCVILGSSVLYHPCSNQHANDHTTCLVAGLKAGLGQSKTTVVLWGWETGNLNQRGWRRTAWRRAG